MQTGASAAAINAARGEDDGADDDDDGEEEDDDGAGAFLVYANILGNAVYRDAALACVLAFRYAAENVVGSKRKAVGIVWMYSYTKAAAAFSAIFNRRFATTEAGRLVFSQVFNNNKSKR